MLSEEARLGLDQASAGNKMAEGDSGYLKF